MKLLQKKYFMLEYKSKHLPLIVSDKVKILNIFKAMSPLITARVQTVDLSSHHHRSESCFDIALHDVFSMILAKSLQT